MLADQDLQDFQKHLRLWWRNKKIGPCLQRDLGWNTQWRHRSTMQCTNHNKHLTHQKNTDNKTSSSHYSVKGSTIWRLRSYTYSILTTAEKTHHNTENNNDENLEWLLFSISSAKHRDTRTRHLRFGRSEYSRQIKSFSVQWLNTNWMWAEELPAFLKIHILNLTHVSFKRNCPSPTITQLWKLSV